MIKPLTALAAVLTAGLFVSTVSAAPMKHMTPKPSGKMVTLYLADRCHMYFTPAQAKKYSYACPDSKGKMKMVKVTPAVAKMQMAKTTAEMAPKKAM